jgi:predicted NUDIX family NTP pyrophosphohydrolase
MAAVSAGILLVRVRDGAPELLLVHPGGPFWAKKDVGAWSIPKGELAEGEDPLAAARREFAEELGIACPCADDDLIELGEVRQAGGKRVQAWCGIGSIDTTAIVSNTFEMAWPPRSDALQRFPEVDRAGYFAAEVARTKVLSGQQPLIDRALRALAQAGRISGVS